MGRGTSKVGGGSTIVNPKVEKTLSQIIKRTANLKKEQYRVINEDGEVVFMKQGKNDRVEMTVGEKRQYLDGATTTHNHPQVENGLGGTFSPNDITDFGYGAKEIVVSSNEGTYRLKNLNFGKPNQTATWIQMRDEMQAVMDKHSTTNNIKRANEMMKSSKVGKEMTSISTQWVKRKNEGASQKELDKLGDKYNKLAMQYKPERSKILRRLEVEPMNDYLRKNAKKYGFAYTYPKNAY